LFKDPVIALIVLQPQKATTGVAKEIAFQPFLISLVIFYGVSYRQARP
jgi:hypothetical protein